MLSLPCKRRQKSNGSHEGEMNCQSRGKVVSIIETDFYT